MLPLQRWPPRLSRLSWSGVPPRHHVATRDPNEVHPEVWLAQGPGIFHYDFSVTQHRARWTRTDTILWDAKYICWYLLNLNLKNKYEPNSQQSQNTHGFPTILLPKNIAHLTIHRVAQISWQRRAFSRVTSFKVDKSDCNSFNLEAMAPVEDRGSSTCKLPKGDLHSRNQLIPCYSRKTNIAPENSCSQKESRTC